MVVVGIGINVTWPDDLPDELADIAVAINHVVDRPVDREDLLIALLEELGPRYDALVAGDRASLLDEWRARSATLGRTVRVDLGTDDVEGKAVDITDEGHLVVETLEGPAASSRSATWSTCADGAACVRSARPRRGGGRRTPARHPRRRARTPGTRKVTWKRASSLGSMW